MKQLFLRTCLSVVALFTAASSFAYNFEVDGIYYYINTGGTSVSVTYKDTKYNSYSGDVTIPSSVTSSSGNTYSVTSIGEYAFFGCSDLTSIEIPSTVTSIGEEAFYNCSGLTSIVIPSSVTKIAKDAFYNCKSLTSIEIPSSVDWIGYKAFNGCSGLTSIVIPSSVTSIASYAFNGCSFSWMILKSVEAVHSNSFDGMTCKVVYVSTASDKQSLAKYYKGTITVLNMKDNPSWKIDSYLFGVDVAPYNPFSFLEKEMESVFGSDEIPTISDLALYKGNEKLKDLTLDEANSCFIDNLEPATTYTLSYTWKWNGEETAMKKTFTTASPSFSVNSSTTQTKLTVNSLTPSSDKTTGEVKETGFTFNYATEYVWKGEPIVLSGLTPNRYYHLECYVVYKNGKKYLNETGISTKELNPTITNNSVTPTAFEGSGGFSYDGDTPPEGEFSINTEYANVIAGTSRVLVTGLTPNTNYTLTYKVSNESVTRNFTTSALTLTTLTPKVNRKGEAFVCAETNISDMETNVGFEWRKTDAPDVVVPKQGAGAVYDGTLEGVLKNLSTDGYYKVRPFYVDAAGKYYYGEWIGFDPSDFSYFEPTVHTYASVSVRDNFAMLSGVVLNGTEDIIEQGFEYWIVDEDEVKSLRGAPATGIQKVLATGERMSVELTGLDAGTTYGYRAFATTASGTTYGDERTFTTTGEKANAIEDVLVGGSQQGGEPTEVARYNLNGVRIATPQHGINIIRMSDGTTRKVLVK